MHEREQRVSGLGHGGQYFPAAWQSAQVVPGKSSKESAAPMHFSPILRFAPAIQRGSNAGMVRRLFWASLYATIGLSLSLPPQCFAQDDENELDDSSDPTGSTDNAQANEASDASDDEGSVDEAAAAAASLDEQEDDQFLSASELSEADLDARINTIDTYLKEMQRPSRLWWYGWLTTQTVLAAGQTFLGLESDDKRTRTSNFVGAGVAGAGLLMVLINPFPGRYASGRYREMPSGTREQKELKLAAGENWLTAQAKADAFASAWPAHVMNGLVAAGVGTGLLLAHENNLKEAVTRTLGVLLIAELGVLTRPTRAAKYSKAYSRSPSSPELALVPMMDRYAQGLSLAGRF